MKARYPNKILETPIAYQKYTINNEFGQNKSVGRRKKTGNIMHHWIVEFGRYRGTGVYKLYKMYKSFGVAVWQT